MAAEAAPTRGAGAPRDAPTGRASRARYLLLTLLAVIVIFPLYITVVNSLLTPTRSRRRPPTFFPFDPQWSTYSRGVGRGSLSQYLSTASSSPRSSRWARSPRRCWPAYAFAFLEFPFKRPLFVVFLATLMVPFEVTLITNLTIVDRSRLVRHATRA